LDLVAVSPGWRTTGNPTENHMGRSLVQLYAVSVCFATLMCFVVALGIALYDVVQIAAAGFTVVNYMLWEDDEQFLAYYPDKKELPEAERRALRGQYRQDALELERRTALQSLVFMGIIIAIDVSVYLVHWRIATRLEQQRSRDLLAH
jgi:hypothetical protein